MGYGKVFVLALIIGAVIFLPFLILDQGYFIYYGDFNVQQVPFYRLCHEAVRNGEWGLNWYTDLGVNFIGSYSVYGLGNPFFYLTLLFPLKAVPYLMAPLLILKLATAAVTSFGYFKRFTKDDRYALLGALLYAFSGYSIYNIFFNHFLEVVAFFPLLLIGMEEFMVNGRRGLFALTVALNAVVNYYFFFGEVLFVVLYFIIRCVRGKEFRFTFSRFFLLGFEAVIGFALGAVILTPSILYILGNPRTSQFLLGWSGIFYGNVQRYGLILSSLFFPPDVPAYPNLFPDSNAKWSSVSLFLPMVSLSGVLAFFRREKKHWAKTILRLCLLLALVPIFNSAFSAFNSAYYARWFYMPILIMALATAKALEEGSERDFHFGMTFTLIPVALFGLIGIFPSYEDGEVVFGQLIEYPIRLLSYLFVVVAGLTLLAMVLKLRKKKALFFRVTTVALSFMIAFTSILMMSFGKGGSLSHTRVVDMGIDGADQFTFLEADSENFYRIDMFNDGEEWCMDNFPMFWFLPTIQTFHSVVSGSIFTFYDSIGYDRNVASRPSLQYEGLRVLTSVKYLLSYEGDEDAAKQIPSYYQYVASENGFDIYENQAFVPMGFAYDYYCTEEDFEDFYEKSRDLLMVKAVMLTDEQIEKYGDLLTKLPLDEYPQKTDEKMLSLAEEKNALSCDSFTYGSDGFTATCHFEKDTLVFFSVPYESGFTATVNGEPVTVENVNNGFMAVEVPAGEAVIVFQYETPGLMLGLWITLGALLVLVLYLVAVKLILKEKAVIFRPNPIHRNTESQIQTLSAEESYIRTISDWAESLSENPSLEPAFAREETLKPEEAQSADPSVTLSKEDVERVMTQSSDTQVVVIEEESKALEEETAADAPEQPVSEEDHNEKE